MSEQEQNSARELERLRRHLVETEESYTQELMTSEQKLTECQTRLHTVEERAKQTSTVYTSNRYFEFNHPDDFPTPKDGAVTI